jgi:exodeoxyribonuclease III
MRIASFNANSLRARMPIVLDWLANARPDVLCVQETKVQDKDFPAEVFDEADTIMFSPARRVTTA